jgi:hypothetical protein
MIIKVYIELFPRTKRKKKFRGPRVWATTIVRPSVRPSVCLSVCRRKSISHFKAREITFSGLITLRYYLNEFFFKVQSFKIKKLADTNPGTPPLSTIPFLRF